MAVVIETTLGDITVDLYLDQRPVTCLNFLKLCKLKYYNYNLFHTIRSDFIAQTGDPTGEGSGGESVWGILEGPEKRFFSCEKLPKIRHTDAGLLSMVCVGDMVGSQFFFTLAPDLDSLDGEHCVIGEVTEGHDVLRKLNDTICDDTHRPYQDVRITHTVILEDPFNDPSGLRAPSRSPSPTTERLKGGRIAPDEEIDETKGKSGAEIQEMIDEKEAKARATILEIIGDLPDADIAPPENVLFVCKLNPVTSDEDLEIIFSRFGKIVSCEVIRDKKSGDSLQYAFIEFADKKSCEDAYFKMDNVLIDDRRIHVDFSQSVSKIKWLGKGRGVKHIDDADLEHNNEQRSVSRNTKNSTKSHQKFSHNSHKKRQRHENNRHNKPTEKYGYSESRTHGSRSRRERSRSKHRSNNRKNNLSHSQSNHSKLKHSKQKVDANKYRNKNDIKTPSPISNKQITKNGLTKKKSRRTEKTIRDVKKKRKPSTSSDSETSTSSSSSDSSSSSSTTSTSTDSSTSSSSSSTDSSSTSSSSSDSSSNKRKRLKKRSKK